MQTLTLGVALGAAAFAGATLISSADAERTIDASQSGIAYVDVFGLVDQLVMQPDETAARVEFEAQGQQALQAVQNRNTEIQGLVQANPEDPNAQQLIAEFQQNREQMQTIYQNYQYDLQVLIAGQISEAYKKVYAAAQTVASEAGVDFVFATRPGSDLIQTDSVTGVAQEILARPLLAPPESVDLTAKVRGKLGLPEPTEQDASVLEGEIPSAPAAAPSTDAGEPDAEQPAAEQP
jgi:Skp family chaperone for outer membrane proteins